MTKGARIKILREKYEMTQDELAKKIGTTKQTIYKYETDVITNIPSDKIEKMAELFSVKPAYLMGWDDTMSTPVYEAAAGEGRYSDGSPTDTLPIRTKNDEICVTVKGHSMEPILYDGDTVIVSPTSVVYSERDIMLVKINGDEATLKHVKMESDGMRLIAENHLVYPTRYFTEDEVKELPITIEGVVVRLIREL